MADQKASMVQVKQQKEINYPAGNNQTQRSDYRKPPPSILRLGRGKSKGFFFILDHLKSDSILEISF